VLVSEDLYTSRLVPRCRICDVELDDSEGGNWYTSSRDNNSQICKTCHGNRVKEAYHRRREAGSLEEHQRRRTRYPRGHCRKCGVKLVYPDNWFRSKQQNNDYICKTCNRLYRKSRTAPRKFPDKACRCCGRKILHFTNLRDEFPEITEREYSNRSTEYFRKMCWKCDLYLKKLRYHRRCQNKRTRDFRMARLAPEFDKYDDAELIKYMQHREWGIGRLLRIRIREHGGGIDTDKLLEGVPTDDEVEKEKPVVRDDAPRDDAPRDDAPRNPEDLGEPNTF
jgi:hypothetical protein